MAPALLYRLFLRATAASVLHHSTATRNLRRLYQPVFIEAARVESQLRDSQDPKARKLLETWLVDWNERVDNTLELLHSSATSRGLSHRLTRNMSFLTDAHLRALLPKHTRSWNSQLPSSSPLYAPPRKPPTANQETALARGRLDATVFNALGQAVRLAEGRSGVILGRLPSKGT